jgi:hypothetical protein
MISVRFPYVYEDVDRMGTSASTSGASDNERCGFARYLAQKHMRYQALLQASESGKLEHDAVTASTSPVPGTWRWLCVEYFRSSAFRRLEPSTQTTRRRLLETRGSVPAPRRIHKNNHFILKLYQRVGTVNRVKVLLRGLRLVVSHFTGGTPAWTMPFPALME